MDIVFDIRDVVNLAYKLGYRPSRPSVILTLINNNLKNFRKYKTINRYIYFASDNMYLDAKTVAYINSFIKEYPEFNLIRSKGKMSQDLMYEHSLKGTDVVFVGLDNLIYQCLNSRCFYYELISNKVIKYDPAYCRFKKYVKILNINNFNKEKKVLKSLFNSKESERMFQELAYIEETSSEDVIRMLAFNLKKSLDIDEMHKNITKYDLKFRYENWSVQ